MVAQETNHQEPAEWKYGQYYPIAHIVEGLDYSEYPDEEQVYEMIQDELENMGLDSEYPPVLDMEIDLDFDYHDYHAEWSYGISRPVYYGSWWLRCKIERSADAVDCWDWIKES